MKEKTTIVLGPPGTGKTTTLLRILSEALASGTHPREVGFISFTRKAANEARDRACVQFNFSPADMPWFRTIHSLCYRCLNIQRGEVMGYSDWKRLAEMLGVELSFINQSEDGTTFGMKKGDRMFFMENLARVTGQSLKSIFEADPPQDVTMFELERLVTTLKEYKRTRHLIDFTDMLESMKHSDHLLPRLRLLFVDEAQDLAPLQWRIVEALAERADKVYVAGDDDQAIFRWSGADVDHFINLEGEQQVLGQSYRVPAAVHRVAHGVVSRILFRRLKQWAPRAEEGLVSTYPDLDAVDLSTGTWLLLARNNYLLAPLVEHCTRLGIPFEGGKSDLRPECLPAIVAWEKLNKGTMIYPADIVSIYDMLAAGTGYERGNKIKINRLNTERPHLLHDKKTLEDEYGLLADGPWYDALAGLTDQEISFFKAARSRGEKLLARPRVKISTIHGAKGGEADNVLIVPDMSRRTFLDAEKNTDDEARVWFVGVTRAKNHLHILEAATNQAYQL